MQRTPWKRCAQSGLVLTVACILPLGCASSTVAVADRPIRTGTRRCRPRPRWTPCLASAWTNRRPPIRGCRNAQGASMGRLRQPRHRGLPSTSNSGRAAVPRVVGTRSGTRRGDHSSSRVSRPRGRGRADRQPYLHGRPGSGPGRPADHLPAPDLGRSRRLGEGWSGCQLRQLGGRSCLLPLQPVRLIYPPGSRGIHPTWPLRRGVAGLEAVGTSFTAG